MKRIPFDEYRPNFKAVAYAFYNQNEVFLFNHPAFHFQAARLALEPSFNGADTRIHYKDVPTSIINLDRYNTFETAYPILIHELFHGYQYLKKEKRCPDELLGSQYPLLPEDVELRNQEREQLFTAVMNEDSQAIQSFISLREKRSRLLGDYIQYEFKNETVEGPAWYVELLAEKRIGSFDRQEAIKKYGQSLLDRFEAALYLRKSGYGSGLFLCLYLDAVSPDWKREFLDTDLTLYEYLKVHANLGNKAIKDTIISHETRKIIEHVENFRSRKFEEFQKQEGYTLCISGRFQSLSFDPINMISHGNRTLHPYSFGFTLNEETYMILQPSVTYFKSSVKEIEKVEVKIHSKPLLTEKGIAVEGIGLLKGEYEEKGCLLFIRLC